MGNPEIIAAIMGGILTIIAAIIGALVATERPILTKFFRWRIKLPPGFVIFINGASGVGKTTIAWALARKYNIASVLETGLIREVKRYDIIKNSEKSPLLYSSFEAYKYDPNGNVTKGCIQQSEILLGPMLMVKDKILHKREPVIIEGVNLIASQLFSKIPNDPLNKVLFINLYLESEKTHLKRLRERGDKMEEQPKDTDRYINNIKAIREIDQFLKDDSIKLTSADEETISNVISIENSGSIRKATNIIDKHLKKKLVIIGKK